MKKLFLLLLIGYYHQIVAQISPSTNFNSVVERIPRIATTSISDDANTILTKVNYFDGRNRSTQAVLYKGTPDKSKDLLLSTAKYDIFSRPIQSVLVVPSTHSNGAYDEMALSKAINFYGDSKPYNQTDFESSPLSRPLKSFGAGEAWYTNNKFVEMRYESAGTGIREYIVSGSGATVTGNYSDNSLYKKTSINERGFSVIEYTDRLGKLVQKDVQDDAGWIQTIYVYDDMDRLTYVLQPLASEILTNGFTESDANFTNYVFAYHYDSRSRVTEKHVPGAGWTYIVYDLRDQPVLSQDASQRALNKWSFTKYDRLGRVISQGELNNTQSRDNLQTLFDGVSVPYETWQGAMGYTNVSFPISYGNTDEKLMNFYDQYDWIANEWAFNASIAYNATSYWSNAKGLQTGSFARSGEDPNKVFHSVMHYDDKHRVMQTYQVHHKGGSTPWTKTIITNYEYNFAGEVTKEKVLYQIDGLANTEAITSHEYDHTGRILKVFHGINATPTEIIKMDYDEVGRLLQKKFLPNGTYIAGGVKEYINRPNLDGIVTQNNTQDVARKAIILEPTNNIDAINLTTYSAQINPNATGGTSISGLQTMNYRWHIRGGLLGINLDNSGNATPKASEGDLFSYKLEYETAGFYDGNIGKQSWQTTKNDNTPLGVRAYTYTYDASSRLKSASFSGLNGENFSLPNLNYDKNGNIQNLQRKGKKGNTYDDIDNLSYNYAGNKLLGVTDGINDNENVGDFRDNGSNNDYTYWENGALKSDGNKGISLIEYDTFLKRVKQISFSNGDWIKFFYDGSGRMFKRSNSAGDVWEYVGAMVFKNGQPYQMSMPEGRAVYIVGDGATVRWVYEFEYRDHQNNLRVAFKADGNQLVQTQTNETDPFGLTIQPLSITGVSPQNYRFQNQEKVADFGLNLNWFKYRPFDPQTGRGWQIDRLADEYVHNSPYAFSENKVTNHIELDGLEAVPVYPSLQGELYRGAGFTHVPNQKESTDLGVKLMKTFATALVTVPLMFLPVEEAVIVGAGVLAKGLGVVAKEIGMAAKVESTVVKGGEAAKSVANLDKLNRQLASESQLAENSKSIAGAGSDKPLRKAEEMAKQYGGSPSDYAKKSTSSYKANDGTNLEIHYEQNVKTGEKFNVKTKINNEQAPSTPGWRYQQKLDKIK